MRGNTVRLSFDIPEDEHTLIKTECAQLRISLKDFLYESFKKGLAELEEKKLAERLKHSIKQSKAGQVKSRGSFAKYAD